MECIRVGIIGMGMIGSRHIETLRRIGGVQIAAISDQNYALARRKAEEFCIPKCYATAEELIADPEIQVVHDCTPTTCIWISTAKSSKPINMCSAKSLWA